MLASPLVAERPAAIVAVLVLGMATMPTVHRLIVGVPSTRAGHLFPLGNTLLIQTTSNVHAVDAGVE